jgi:iron-sulfur cluster protein
MSDQQLKNNQQFKKEIKKALTNPTLRSALGKFGKIYPQDREKSFQDVDFLELRDRMKAIKVETVENLLELADRFEREAAARGAKVFRAEKGEDAARYILNLAREHGVTSLIKSKSMATEEIHLNEYLIKAGLEVVETDLGEWIIQQAGQRPSHMVMPCIHMSKEQVAELFSRTLGEEVPPDISSLVQIARRELRKKFLSAGMGISGANVAVAETGTIVLFSNEGNIRLTTTLPPIHVVLVGYEKIVPRFTDIETVARLLPRSATAQKLTSYVSLITGSVPAFNKKTGTEELKDYHIILLDNGRLDMARDPVFREAFQCLRCGACLNVCPVYQLVGGHVYGHIYSGGIGNILTAFLHSFHEADQPQSLCMQCRKCADTCPGAIDIPKLIFALRGRLEEKRPLPFVQRMIFEQVLAKRRRFHRGLALGSKLQRPLTKGTKFIRHLPFSLRSMAEFRSLPALAPKPFRALFREIHQEVKVEKGKILFFAGCMVDFMYPEVGRAVVRVLNQKGYRVLFPEGQSCCGAPAVYAGDFATGRELAKQNIAALERDDIDNIDDIDYIVSACPTCTDFLVQKFGELLKDDETWAKRGKKVAAKAIDFVQLVDQLNGSGINSGAGGSEELGEKQAPRKITYHTACHLKRSRGIYDEPRRVLENAGCEIVEMEENDRCCGLGGSYAIKFPEISAPILERKLDHIESTGVDTVVCDCPGCLMQLKGGLDKRNSPIQVKHTAET